MSSSRIDAEHHKVGVEKLRACSCLNDHPEWITALATISHGVVEIGLSRMKAEGKLNDTLRKIGASWISVGRF